VLLLFVALVESRFPSMAGENRLDLCVRAAGRPTDEKPRQQTTSTVNTADARTAWPTTAKLQPPTRNNAVRREQNDGDDIKTTTTPTKEPFEQSPTVCQGIRRGSIERRKANKSTDSIPTPSSISRTKMRPFLLLSLKQQQQHRQHGIRQAILPSTQRSLVVVDTMTTNILPRSNNRRVLLLSGVERSRQRLPLWFSSTSASRNADHHKPMSMDTAKERDMVYYRQELIRAALKKVHTLGWTQDAILAAIVEPLNDNNNNTSPAFAISMAGLVTPFELVAHCMDDWNDQLEQFLLLHKTKKQQPSMRAYYREAIQFRLSLALPYIQSGQWHTAMALGATQNIMTTHGQVHRIVELMTMEDEDASTSSSTTTPRALHKAAVGAIYVATELHLLTDTSPNYQDTWTFLEHRLADYDQLRSSSSSSSGVSGAVSSTVQAAVQSAGHLLGSLSTTSTITGPVAFATTAVLSSFLEGAASILLPVGGKAPTSETSTNRPTTGAVVFGTNPNDYAPPSSSMSK
jgi:ubiquinone biosynthesis protein COQ9